MRLGYKQLPLARPSCFLQSVCWVCHPSIRVSFFDKYAEYLFVCLSIHSRNFVYANSLFLLPLLCVLNLSLSLTGVLFVLSNPNKKPVASFLLTGTVNQSSLPQFVDLIGVIVDKTHPAVHFLSWGSPSDGLFVVVNMQILFQ